MRRRRCIEGKDERSKHPTDADEKEKRRRQPTGDMKTALPGSRGSRTCGLLLRHRRLRRSLAGRYRNFTIAIPSSRWRPADIEPVAAILALDFHVDMCLLDNQHVVALRAFDLYGHRKHTVYRVLRTATPQGGLYPQLIVTCEHARTVR